jgi:multidrug efflux system membrane fusion protein
MGKRGRNLRWRSGLLGFCLAWAGALTGCSHSPPQLAPAEPRAIPVSHPVGRVVTDYVDFTGRTDAVLAVDVRARVTGYLMETPFKEGAEVKKGDVLFVVDTRPYQAQLDQAEGQVNRSQAQLELAKATFARYQGLASSEPGAVSKQALDQYKAQVIEADAALKAAQASLEVYKLNLSFCKVTSPIAGQASRYYLTPGNLVNQDQSLLTTVVSLDPMYAYFDVDEPTLLKVYQAIEEGKILQQPQGGGSRSRWRCRGRPASRTGGRSTSSTTR